MAIFFWHAEGCLQGFGHMQGERPVKKSHGEPGCVKYPVIYTLQRHVKTPFTHHCVAVENCIALMGEMNWSSDVFLWKCVSLNIYSLVSNCNTVQLLYETASMLLRPAGKCYCNHSSLEPLFAEELASMETVNNSQHQQSVRLHVLK